MNFFTIIRSIEELLYEVVTWLLFYPLTLWRCLTRPQELMAYTTEELTEAPDTRFTETISPPLFLMLSVLVAHGIELAVGARVGPTAGMGEVGRAVVTSEQNLLFFRSFVFALFPLVMAVGVARRKKLQLTRDTLKAPFYRQCYFAAPFCLFMSAGGTFLRQQDPPFDLLGPLMLAAGVIWYLQVEARWLHRELSLGYLAAFWLSLRLFLLAAAMVIAIAILVVFS